MSRLDVDRYIWFFIKVATNRFLSEIHPLPPNFNSGVEVVVSKIFRLYTGEDNSHISGSLFNCFLDKCSLSNQDEKKIVYNLIGHVYDPDFDFANFIMDKNSPEMHNIQVTCLSGIPKATVPEGKETLASQIYTTHCLMEYILFDHILEGTTKNS